MLVDEPDESLLLPPRTRLLHIGPMKTGTTSVQAAAQARRDILLANGVRYPGTAKMHRRHLGALMGFSVETWRRSGPLRPDLMDVDTAGIPSQAMWDELRAEIDADTERRIFLTHEFVSQADDATAQRVVDGIGGPVHVCITVRAPGQIVPSLWAQGIKDDAQTEPYLEWLERLYGKNPDQPISGRYQRMYDEGQLAQRWAKIVGPENVTVIVVDPAHPRQLTSALEAMLGLPSQTLDWKRTNRSLTAVESELFRQVNITLRDRKASWATFDRLVFKGAIMRGLGPRPIPSDEPRVVLPQWAAAIAADDGRRFAATIRESGVRVVGDLDVLAAEPRAGEWEEVEQVPLDLAARAVSAAILSGQDWKEEWKKRADSKSAQLAKARQEPAERTPLTLAEQVQAIPSAQRAGQAAAAFSTSDLAAALAHRLRGLPRRAERRLQRLRERTGGHPSEVAETVPTGPSLPEPKASLRSIGWTDSGELRISGWAYVPGHDVDQEHSRLEVWAEGKGGRRVAASVVRSNNPEVDVVVQNSQHDYAGGWFEAVFAADPWAGVVDDRSFAERMLTVRLRYTERDQESGRDRTAECGFRSRAAGGSPGLLLSRPFDDGLFVRPVWQQTKGGLRIRLVRRAVLATASLDDHGLDLLISTLGSFAPNRLRIAPGVDLPGLEFELRVAAADQVRAQVPIRQLQDALAAHTVVYLLAVDETGAVRHLHWQSATAGDRLVAPGAPEIELQARPAGEWRLELRRGPVLDAVRFDTEHDRLIISGHLPDPAAFDQVVLSGALDSRKAVLRTEADGHFSATVELIGPDRWGNTDLAPVSGTYRLHFVAADQPPVPSTVSARLVADLDQLRRSRLIGCHLQRQRGDQLAVIIEPPLTATERSKRGRQQLQAWSDQADEPLRDAIFFESFGGKFAACNPRAIMQRVVDLGLPYDCYWCVRDHAVPIPAGATPVVYGSEDWWRVRATSRYLVLNGWVHESFPDRPGQVVLQTFHGTPYKKLAMDRTALRAPRRGPVLRESSKWDYLVVQSDYMAERMASAYGYQGQVLRAGYPRDDILSLPEGKSVRQSLRRRLGIGDDQLCILYAPTLREDRTKLVSELELERVADAFGDRAVVLVRGHYTMSRRGRDLTTRTIDVTGYPQAEDLFLASDVAITDYSSIMFDYTAGGKPLLFFVPDLEQYASTVRGVYFDLEEIAPGPLLSTTDEVIEALQSLDQVRDRYRDRYLAWQQRFNPWDDGHAADRVIEAVFSPNQESSSPR